MDKARENAATDCYVVGYPLMLSHVASRGDVMRNEVRFLAHPDAELEHSVGMNGRVMTAIAWMDLRREPIVIALPRSNRYYTASLFDAWTQLIAPLGTRITGDASCRVAVIGPGCDTRAIPPELSCIEASTNLVGLLVRVAALREPELHSVATFLHEIDVVPLREFLYGRRTTAVEGSAPTQRHVVAAVEAMSGSEFFAELAVLHPELAWPKCGADRAAVDEGVELAQHRIQSYDEPRTRSDDWWIDGASQASSPLHFLRRAAVARKRLHAELQFDYLRLVSDRDAYGRPLEGGVRYGLRIERHDEPPARGPWSIGAWPLRTQVWPSVMAVDEPGARMFHLSSDDEPFHIVLHAFWPEDRLLSGGWVPPKIERLVDKSGA